MSHLNFRASRGLSVAKNGSGAGCLISKGCFGRSNIVGGGKVAECSLHTGLSRGLDGCMGVKVGLATAHGRCSGIPLNDNRGRGTKVLISTTRFGPTLPVQSRGNGCSVGSSTSFLPGPISLLSVASGAARRHLLTGTFFRIHPVSNLLLGTGFNVSHGCRGLGRCLPAAALCKRHRGNTTSVTRNSGSSCLVRLATGCAGRMNSRGFGTLINRSCRLFACRVFSKGDGSFVASNFLCGGLNTNGTGHPAMKSDTAGSHVTSFFNHLGCAFGSHCLLATALHTSNSSGFTSNRH